MSDLCPDLFCELPVAGADSGPNTKPVIIALSGAPGSGKSTLGRMLSAVLTGAGRRCQLLSLDDYYLPLKQRLALAEEIHPLCAVRGVPGTHDFSLLLDHLDRLVAGNISGLRTPMFDKATDDRLPEGKPIQLHAPLDYVLLEGWVCGTPPQLADALTEPVNRMEAEKDATRVWRQWVNQNLQDYQTALSSRVQARWYIQAPDWEAVVRWRWQQERDLPVAGLKSIDEIQTFLAHYQRLVQHMQATSKQWADLIITMDEAHCATMPPDTRSTGQ